MTAQEQDHAGLEARIDALQVTVAALEKQISRAGREQLKANALAEVQAERLAAALEALRGAGARHAGELEAATTEARLQLARAMLPTIDGLDEAIRAGELMLAHHAAQEPADALLRRLLHGGPPPEARPEAAALRGAMRAWLEGLALVRRRLLDALAAEGIALIAAVGRPFDPRRHIAVEVLPADAPGGVVLQEVRRGFLAGERVLRHVEVAVAGEPQPKDQLP
jgi:molecular chaperone GrpE (heat shock protein)